MFGDRSVCNIYQWSECLSLHHRADLFQSRQCESGSTTELANRVRCFFWNYHYRSGHHPHCGTHPLQHPNRLCLTVVQWGLCNQRTRIGVPGDPPDTYINPPLIVHRYTLIYESPYTQTMYQRTRCSLTHPHICRLSHICLSRCIYLSPCNCLFFSSPHLTSPHITSPHICSSQLLHLSIRASLSPTLQPLRNHQWYRVDSYSEHPYGCHSSPGIRRRGGIPRFVDSLVPPPLPPPLL